jgi:DNA mismatch endonuclease, patch repair protein
MPKLQSFKKLERRLVRDARPLTTAETSARMARVRRTGTAPEVQVRRYLSSLGIRYRTRNRDLPGAPDLANRSKKWALFVHGCFWHQHEQCKSATMPKTNQSFWRAKFTANRIRDARACQLLDKMGYSVKTIWECQTRGFATIGKAVGRLPQASKAKRRSRRIPDAKPP